MNIHLIKKSRQSSARQFQHPVSHDRKRELLRVLVATDIAARGLTHDDRPLMAAIERLMNGKIQERVIAGFEPGSANPGRSPNRRASASRIA